MREQRIQHAFGQAGVLICRGDRHFEDARRRRLIRVDVVHRRGAADDPAFHQRDSHVEAGVREELSRTTCVDRVVGELGVGGQQQGRLG